MKQLSSENSNCFKRDWGSDALLFWSYSHFETGLVSLDLNSSIKWVTVLVLNLDSIGVGGSFINSHKFLELKLTPIH